MKNHRSKKTAIPFTLRLLRFIYNTAGRVFPLYFGNRAYEQWFTTIRFKTPAFERHVLESACHESIIVNDIPVAVYIWQDKSITQNKTLIFIHGWTGRGSQIAPYIKKLNAIGYRVISFDGIAHGKTPGAQTSALEMADILLALNKHYGKFDAAITHSLGGMVLMYSMSLGLKISHAALISPPNSFQILIDNFQRILTLPETVIRIVIRKSFASHGQVIRDALSTTNNVKNLNCKGLILHDENDLDISWRSGEEIANAWPGARFIKTKNLGHRKIIRDETVVSSIIDFMNNAIE